MSAIEEFKEHVRIRWEDYDPDEYTINATLAKQLLTEIEALEAKANPSGDLSDAVNALHHIGNDHPCCKEAIEWIIAYVEGIEKDKKRYKQALWFIYNACDWEEFHRTGDERIGEVTRKVCAEGKAVSMGDKP